MGFMQKRRTEKDLATETVLTSVTPEDVLAAASQFEAAAGTRTAIVAYGKRLTPVLRVERANEDEVVVRVDLHHPTKGRWGESYAFRLTWSDNRVTCSSDALLLRDGSMADRRQFLAVKDEVLRVLG